MNHRVFLIIVLIACSFSAVSCRPQACLDASPLIEKVRIALDAGRMDAASSGLAELSERLRAEGGYLAGFGSVSASLHQQLERQHDLGSLSERDQDVAQRRLGPLIQGWYREARAVERRCNESYLL